MVLLATGGGALFLPPAGDPTVYRIRRTPAADSGCQREDQFEAYTAGEAVRHTLLGPNASGWRKCFELDPAQGVWCCGPDVRAIEH